MKRDNKKALYESIMTSVAREVKKTLNESVLPDDPDRVEDCLYSIKRCLHMGCDFAQYEKYINNDLSTDSKKFYMITGSISECIQQAFKITQNLSMLAGSSNEYRMKLSNDMSIQMLERCKDQLNQLSDQIQYFIRFLNKQH